MTDVLLGVGLAVFLIYGSLTLVALTAIPAARQAAQLLRAAAAAARRWRARRRPKPPSPADDRGER